MKLITAMIRAHELEAVQIAAAKQDAYITGASETLDLRSPITGTYRGARYRSYERKTKIEIVVTNDAMVQEVVDAIAQAAAIGDPAHPEVRSMFVTTLDEWVRIPSGSAQAALELETVGERSRRAS